MKFRREASRCGTNANRQFHAGSLLGPCVEDKVQGDLLAFTYGDFLALRAEDFMPGRHGVFSRRKLRQSESTIFSCNRKVVGLQNDKISVHPRVNVAFYRDELRA